MDTEAPVFHDGYLTGILLADGQAAIFMPCLNGENWRPSMEGLQALQMEDFRQGNFIYGVKVVTGDTPDRISPMSFTRWQPRRWAGWGQCIEASGGFKL